MNRGNSNRIAADATIIGFRNAKKEEERGTQPEAPFYIFFERVRLVFLQFIYGTGHVQRDAFRTSFRRRRTRFPPTEVPPPPTQDRRNQPKPPTQGSASPSSLNATEHAPPSSFRARETPAWHHRGTRRSRHHAPCVNPEPPPPLPPSSAQPLPPRGRTGDDDVTRRRAAPPRRRREGRVARRRRPRRARGADAAARAEPTAAPLPCGTRAQAKNRMTRSRCVRRRGG